MLSPLSRYDEGSTYIFFTRLQIRAQKKKLFLCRVELSWTNLPPTLVTSLLQMEAAAKVKSVAADSTIVRFPNPLATDIHGIWGT